MQKALHGDKVLVREIGVDRRGRREATIVEVLEYANTKLVGRLHIDHGILSVSAENKRISQDILIAKEHSLKARSGQVVMVEIIQQPSKYAQPIGKIVEILGDYTAPGMEIEIALRKHDLPHVFSDEIEDMATRFPKRVLKKESKGRVDLCALPLVTIDGETARDFDDAVFLLQQPKLIDRPLIKRKVIETAGEDAWLAMLSNFRRLCDLADNRTSEPSKYYDED